MLKKIKGIDHYYFVIILFCLALLYIVVPENCIFGSKIDWVSQHIVFPDYFRKLFYSNHKLFPNFALSIGAGQNIYNFSYYGLLNPLIIFSYLLPNVSMTSYIIFVNVFLYLFFGIILYYFLKTKFERNSSLVTTLIILCSSSLLFHFHKHYMFVDYLPFLVLGLIATDRYFEKNDRISVSICVLLLVLISYYYSILSIAVLCIYALYLYLKRIDKIIFKNLVKEALLYLLPVITGILMSGVLILPTLYVLSTGRSDSTLMIDFYQYFLPKYNLDGILYGNYSLGLTVISLLAFIYLLFSKKKEDRYLFFVLASILFIPIFIYLLNGNLYFRNKVLIPLLPLFAYLLAKFIDQIFKRELSYLYLMIEVVIVIFTSFFLNYINFLFYVEILFLPVCLYFYSKRYTNKVMLSLILFIVPLCVLLYSNQGDKYVEEGSLNRYSLPDIEEEINQVLEKEKGIVRFNHLDDTLRNVNEVFIDRYNHDSLYSSVSNVLYQNFYKKVFRHALSYRNNLVLAQNNDILFQMFMGVKYIYSTDQVPIGYQQIAKNIYQNDQVLPLFYGTSSLTDEKIFHKLKYPYHIATLLNSAVVPSKSTKDVTNSIIEETLEYEVLSSENLKIKDQKGEKRIISTGQGKAVLKLKNPLKKDILIIRIKLANTPNCNQGDAEISINGITNVLTCKQWLYKNNHKTFDYVISSNEDIEKLVIEFSKNRYHIKDVKTYRLSYDCLLNSSHEWSTFNIKDNSLHHGKITGTMKMEKDGYFISSIPYDSGFRVYVDHKKRKTQIVNTSFLGFKLEKGEHDIRIEYTSPWFREGVICSLFGLFLFTMSVLYRKKEKNQKT